MKWRSWLEKQAWTTLFIDGNHDNHRLLRALPEANMFGGIVGYASNNILHLRRGEVYLLNGHTFFTFGGAMSTDRMARTEGVDWWPEEIASEQEMQHGLKKLRDVACKVDYILTHTAPKRIILAYFENYIRAMDPTAEFLDFVEDTTEFKSWYFAHFHRDGFYEGQFIFCYNRMHILDNLLLPEACTKKEGKY